MKSISEMTRKDFNELPNVKWDEDIGEFNSIVILPSNSKDLHESGYRCMAFVAVRNGEAICRLSECSNVIRIDGVGGYGYKWLERYGTVPSNIPPSGWSIDCLPKSGLLHMWPGSYRMKSGVALSSFDIFALPNKKKVEVLPNSVR